MAEDKGKINFMRGFADESEQEQAYLALVEYLVSKGKYANVDEADDDASDRVHFCEEINLYTDDEQLKTATIHEKKIRVLIQANDLWAVIAKNNGTLPYPDHAAITHPPAPEEADHLSFTAKPAPERDTVLEAIEKDGLESPEEAVNETLTAVEDIPRVKHRPYLQAALHFGKLSIVISIVLLGLTIFYSGEQQLQIIKYGFYLFTALIFLFAGLYEVSGKILICLRHVVGNSLIITTASLSGLMFMQRPWLESTFTVYDGFQGLIVNPIVHSVLSIGPHWTGMFFAVLALLLFFATRAAGVPKANKLR
jgi:hypothetical protein